MTSRKRLRWLPTLLIQFFTMAALSAAACLLPLFIPEAQRALSIALDWILLPLTGALTACFLTVRGCNNYLSWPLPPLLYAALPLLIIGFPPDAGCMLLIALLSLIGAATGDVLKREKAKN